MKTFTAKTFEIPKLKGISAKSIEEHLKLYQGYVKHANLILEKMEELRQDPDKNAYLLGELTRRFSFEYNGVRNHEIYFASLEGGPVSPTNESLIKKAIEIEWNSLEKWSEQFKATALTRGIGWAVLWYDHKDQRLLISWVDEQHLGQLSGCTPIIALDMWEHSYVYDYQPSGKKQYIEDFFTNLNWSVIENNFKHA